MVLNDDDSWEFIKKCLRNAEWSDEEIENISDESLEQVVNILNEKLINIHEKSEPIIQQAIKANKALELWYDMQVAKLAEQYGEEIPVLLFMPILEEYKRKQEELKENYFEKLNNS
jgi:hypothetical protein